MQKVKTRFEGAAPILCVRDMTQAVRYYVDVLGFENAQWGDHNFTSVNRDQAGIYLSAGEYQGLPGAWVWVGVEDTGTLYEELKASEARIRHAPRNYPWALEFHVEDLDGNVLRMGSEPDPNRPYDEWMA
jgi:hypothetical protein